MRNLLIWFLLFAPIPAAADQSWKPKADQVAHLEKILKMPAGTHPMGEYGRHYWGDTVEGARVIRGTLVYGERVGVYLANTAPLERFTDQGCDRVRVQYNLSKNRVIASCDGTG